ncbi:MAG: amidohydrolase family protein [Oligoflexus sp.]
MRRAFLPAKLCLGGICALLLSSLVIAEEESDKEKATWDVNQPPGQAEFIKLDVNTGTWMNLDISPDGKTIVFDLLGDIYTIPRKGGEATALTRGMAWNMQPRFSPDGKWIAFTSDRNGGDNIWVMAADGSQITEVTKEKFRLLNNPSWSPDGQYIAARKHFTKTRSLGAGEIWLYHRSGGEGLPLVERSNDQKDMNEPAFSVDGRFLYFTQDTTPGDTFAYDKDPHGGIYEIRRLDRQTGELSSFIKIPGGAIHPRPSPDGKHLAFIRRVGTKTVLFLKDLHSGKLRPVYDGLERDMQEIWAIHGVYANLAWAPDSGSLIFWAGGRIQELNLKSGKVATIPFRVQDQREIRAVQRPPVNPAPVNVAARMLRWVEVSPRGDQVVYSAQGRLYVRDLPEGKAKRLTRDEENFEFYPSYSPDGKTIIYASWNDKDHGRIRTVASRGGRSRILTEQPGHYAEPRFSPDAKQIVYRRLSGSYLTGPWWDMETGLFVMPANGGKSVKIAKNGDQAHFAASSDRVYFLRYEAGDNRQLVSVDLNGANEKVHVNSSWATHFQVSPDGKWLAFQERYHAYVMPFPAAGKAYQIAPNMKSLPLSRVSREAGDFIHWSGDSQQLHWSTGEELYSLPLDKAFRFLSGKEQEDIATLATMQPIGFVRPADVPQGTIALVGARVISMVGDQVIPEASIIVKGNKIQAVGPKAAVQVPQGAKVVDLAGKTIIPGMIDAHWHGPQGYQQIIPQENWYNHASIAFGVTSYHDPSSDTHTVFTAHEMQQAGDITAPRIFSTGRILYGATTDFTVEVNSFEDAKQHLLRLQKAGAFSVKSYNQPRRDQRQQIIAAANELGMHVHPEGGALFQHNMTMIIDGHSGVEHSLSLPNVYDDVLQLWSQTKVAYTPTMGVAYGGFRGENYWYAESDVFAHPRLTRFVPRELIDPAARRRSKIPNEEYAHFAIAAHSKKLMERGVVVNMGAHGQREGLAAHWEMWMFAQGGMDPLDSLRTATMNPARYLGMDQYLGSIEVGKLADLVVLDRNPLENIRHTETVRYTMVNGRLYDAWSMKQIAPEQKDRGKFWWERDEG